MSSEFPPGPGGIGNHAENLAIYLSTQGLEILVYAAARNEFPHRSHDESFPFSITRYSVSSHLLAKLYSSCKYLFTHSDVSCIVLSGQMQLLLVLFIKLFTRAQTVCVIHGSEFGNNRILNKILKVAFNISDHVVAVSDFTRSRINAIGYNGKINIIPNGIVINKSSFPIKQPPRDGVINLVTVGSLTKRKGQYNVINALPFLVPHYSRIAYHMVGIPVDEEEIVQLAKNLNVEQHIKIHGAMSEADKLSLLNDSSIFLMLSENLPDGDVEGFGIAILEANILGIPAIGSIGTGVTQAINHGITGQLVDPKSPIQIQKALSVILYNYPTYSHNAIEWAKMHNWEVVGDRYFEILSV